MSLGGNRTTFNLEMLAKLFYVISKIAFKNLTEQQKVHYEPKSSTMDRFTSNLKSKFSIAFNSAEDLIRFMDLSATESLRIEEFMFGTQFFCSNVSLPEVILLFKKLDTNNDGIIDANDIRFLIP